MQNQVSDREILELSQKTKEIAVQIIKKKKIIETLSKFGEPIIIGSYALDLMIDEDIDIVVKTTDLKVNAQNALNKFIELGIANKYEFGDFIKYPRKNRPKGYIVNLKLMYNEINWEVEIWFLSNNESYLQALQEYKSKINDEKRQIILNQKYQRKISGQTKHQISSTEIYEDILN